MLHPDLFALARNLLELAADAFARNSSNDYTLPDLDPEARAQLAALVTAGRGSDEEPDTAEAFGPEAIVSDWQIMLALARGLVREGSEIQQFIWDTNAAKETAVQQERAAVVDVVIEYAEAHGLSLAGKISGLTPAELVRHALHHALWAHQRVDEVQAGDPQPTAAYRERVRGLLAKATGGAPLDFADGVAMVGELIRESAHERDAHAASVIDTMAATLDETSAALAERDAKIAKLQAELAPFRARDGARRARMARSADDE